MPPRAIVALGIGQCVNWGVLYYTFAVLILPLQRELDVATWVVTGAFSVALLMSALVAPTIGRWSDRGHGGVLIQAGGFAAAGLLVLWTAVPGTASLYAAWTCLGVCMAAALYEPAFVVVAQAHQDPTMRLRALALVTVLGGMASTVFLPVAWVMVDRLGWRAAVLTLAAALAASTWLVRALVFRPLPRVGLPRAPAIVDEPNSRARGPIRGFGLLQFTFGYASLASAAFMANIVPALGERAVTPGRAAMLGSVLGVMQLPGRAMLMTGRLSGSAARLMLICLLSQGVGLLVMTMTRSTVAIVGGFAMFAAGAGLTTVVRPHVVHSAFGVQTAGYLNGQLARAQQLARSAGPIGVAWLGATIGYGAALAGLSLVFAVLSVWCYHRLGDLVSRQANADSG